MMCIFDASFKQVYDYVFVPEKGDKGEWVTWMSTTEKYSVDPKLQFNEVCVRVRARARVRLWGSLFLGISQAQNDCRLHGPDITAASSVFIHFSIHFRHNLRC